MALELSEETKNLINEYMNDGIEQGTGAIRYSIYAFRDWMIKQTNHKDYVEIKIKGQKAEREITSYFKGMPADHNWNFNYKYLNLVGKKEGKIIYMIDEYFTKNIGTIAEIFIRDIYETLDKAIAQTYSWKDVWNSFMKWFEVKRGDLMNKTKEKIESTDYYKQWLATCDKRAISEKKKEQMLSHKPSSHGAVANLLKVLTKTLVDQGSDITTIAKTQYLVCMQAGIYLPDEFITDVATSLDIQNKL